MNLRRSRNYRISPGVGLDPCRSLPPPPAILWFCDLTEFRFFFNINITKTTVSENHYRYTCFHTYRYSTFPLPRFPVIPCMPHLSSPPPHPPAPQNQRLYQIQHHLSLSFVSATLKQTGEKWFNSAFLTNRSPTDRNKQIMLVYFWFELLILFYYPWWRIFCISHICKDKSACRAG